MNRRRLLISLVSTVAVLALILYGSRWSPPGFATPTDCINAYRDACKNGDVARYSRCLAEPLRSTKQPVTQSADLQRQMDGVLSWSQLEPVIRDATAYVDVDRVKTSGTQRIRFHLERFGKGWLIVRIDEPKDVPTPIRPGTHVGDAP